MIVCRLCLTASTDVIHIFREYGIQLKVSSILSKHFGSLFEVTEEHDEAICSSCWAHTESFHAFYQSIKSAQNCYSSEDEDDGCQPDGQQNVKIIMYDSVTNEVIEQRHDGSSDHQHHSHQLQQPSDQQQHHYQVDGGTTTTVSTGYDTFEVCEQTTDSSDLDLLMMMHPNDGGVPTTDDNGHHHQQHPHQQHMVSVNEHGLALDVDEVDDDQDEGLQQHHHEQQQHQTGMGMDPIMGSVSHRTDTSSVMSEFLQNNEHITVIEVSSPSQAQKLLQQQQQQQQQLQLQQQQHPQQSRQPPPLMHHATSTRIVQRPFAASSTTSTTSSLMPNNADALAMRKRKMPNSSPVAVPNAPAVGTIVQRKQPPPGGYPHQRYVDLSDPESPPDTPNTSLDTSTGSAIMSPSYTSTGGGGGGAAGAEPYRMQCDLCSKTFKTFHRVQTHYQMKHNMNGYVMCCGDQFFEKDLLVDHILMHVNNRRQMKKISCAHCEQFFYRKRFYTRHLLKVHNIGTVGNGSEPDSPTAAATQAPVTLSTSSTLTTTPTAIPLHCSGDGIVASLPATTASQSTVRPAHIIRRVINAPATTIGTTIVAGGNSGQSQMQPVNSGTKMPMIVNIQSIVPKSRTSTMAMTVPTQTSTRMIASVNNGGAGGGLMSNVDVKFELKDVKDDMILGS